MFQNSLIRGISILGTHQNGQLERWPRPDWSSLALKTTSISFGPCGARWAAPYVVVRRWNQLITMRTATHITELDRYLIWYSCTNLPKSGRGTIPPGRLFRKC